MTEIEVVRGVEVPKASPKRRHAQLQWVIAEILGAWAGNAGEVGTEWRFWLTKPGESTETTLVPDVAYVSVARMAELSDDEAEEPPFAPDIAVEIRSPGDRERNIETKIHLYLGAGSRLVLDVDSVRRCVVGHDQHGSRTFDEAVIFEHSEAPGLSFSVRELFARSDRKR
ncbi:MAG: Uma2 family endonuclease [Candidatus Eremiobacteraeota bacterium]|nr:Uma2 family endonuclease [Candidatus Eremiobacteraeota bacterium]